MKIGNNTEIDVGTLKHGKNCIIGDNVKIKVRGTFELGDCSIIHSGTEITCNEFIAGEYLFMGKNVEIGRGGCMNPDANVKIGDHVGIFEGAMINPNSPVNIGDNVGIGDGVMIWTHGAWLDITKGFPADFGPVNIGNDTWLPARCVVLPNINIGSNVVIGIGSIINKNIPNGSLAAGVPCKVIRENYYPIELSDNDIGVKMDTIITRWVKDLVPVKDIRDINISYNLETRIINLFQNDNLTEYDIMNKSITGYNNDVTEDFRDFLRRNGIKIYNGELFKSVPIR